MAGVVLSLAMIGCDTGKPTAASDAAPSGGTASTSTDSSTPSAANRPVSTGAGNTATGDAIPIGLVASMSGDQQPWGLDSKNGAQLAVDEFNKAGGLNGKKINLILADDASKPEQGKSATEKLVGDDKVVGVIGEVMSGVTLQMAPVCQDNGVPDIAVGATRNDITNIGNDIFRVCYTDSLQGPVMANFAYNQLGLRKVGVMTDKTQPYSTGLSDAFMATFKKLGGTIVDQQFYEAKQTQFTPQITQLKSESPEGVFASGYFTEVGPMVKQAAEAGLKIPFFGGDGWDAKNINETGGAAILGDYFCNHYDNHDPSQQVKDFLAKWKTTYGGEPATAMGALAYDATGLMLDALKRSKGTDSKDLRDAIDDTVGYKGVSGDVTLKGNHGDPPKRAIIVQITKDGPTFKTAIDPTKIVK